MFALELTGNERERISQFDSFRPQIGIQSFSSNLKGEIGAFDHEIIFNHMKQQIPYF